MRILIVSSYLPYPLFSGGQIRLYNLIKELGKKHLITLVCEIRPNQTREDIEELKKICKEVMVIPRKKQWSLTNIVKSGLSLDPFLLVGHKLAQMEQEIKLLLQREQFDLIHVETFYVLQNVPKTTLPIVLVEHNIEYLVYERYKHTASVMIRPLLSVDITKIKYQEKKAWKQVDALVAVSDEEKEKMDRGDVAVVPNGVDVTKFVFIDSKRKFLEKEKKILFIGDFKWIQNQVALEMILKEIWPEIKLKIKNQTSNVTLWIVGRHIPNNLKALGDETVIFDEHAPRETEKIYERAYALLAPITVGGGTSYKILESMASGLPVVTTPLGIVGIHAKDGQEALVGVHPSQLAGHILSLCSDEKLFTTIAKNARKHIETYYTWPMIAQKLEGVYLKTIKHE